MDFGIVPDMTVPGAFNQAVKSNPPFTAVLHQASPFPFATVTKSEDFLLPAIEGTTNLLNAVKEFAPEVRRVIYTSSCAAVIDFEAPIATNPPKVYTDADWNPVTTEAETELRFRVHQSANDLGPMFHPAASVKEINEKMPPGGVHPYADVRDLAIAHVRAVTTLEAGGERIIVSSKSISSQEIADLLRGNFEELGERTPIGTPGEISLPDGAYSVSNEKAKRLLGLTFRSDEECFVPLGKQFLEIEKADK
ncbi:related to dihydroflavonol-4-reductase [Phialocephala subalpina]|uniref:Related to dihydroflavonol-4-reductase n=1 Tax=Phialocephala subalpina TaxID=576137 RepID=A0A1L7XUH0_9HELO|nr:related to dihydroflavonol-4-reductase [Phialocephala subalpina]